MNESTAAIVKVIAEVLLGIGGLSGLISVLVNRQKTKSEAKNIDSQAKNLDAQTGQVIPANAAGNLVETSGDVIEQYKKLLEDYQTETNRRIDNLQQMLSKYAKRIMYLMGGIQVLVKQVVDLGHDPCWSPDDWVPWEEAKKSDEKPDPGILKG